MSKLSAALNAEPVAIAALVQAGLTLLVAFGLHLTTEQIAAILTFTGALLAVLVRGKVTAPATIAHIDPALITGNGN